MFSMRSKIDMLIARYIHAGREMAGDIHPPWSDKNDRDSSPGSSLRTGGIFGAIEHQLTQKVTLLKKITLFLRTPGRTRTCDTRFRKPLLYPN